MLCPSCSGPVSIFRPLGSSEWPEGLCVELERNLLSPSQPRRILLPSAPSPSPKYLPGRQALCHVTTLKLPCLPCQTDPSELWSGGTTSSRRTMACFLFINSMFIARMRLGLLHALINCRRWDKGTTYPRHFHVPEKKKNW